VFYKLDAECVNERGKTRIILPFVGVAMCSYHIRCHVGPKAKEMFVFCRPDSEKKNIVGQTESVYRLLEDAVQKEEGTAEHILRETVFFRDVQRDFEVFQKTRSRIMGLRYAPVATFVQQAPIGGELLVGISGYALIPTSGPLESRPGTPSGRAFRLGGARRLFLANICGLPGDSGQEAYSMFEAAEKELQREQLSFRDVIRTWIHLRDIERDYDGLNFGRTKFFREQGLAVPPASTAIEGASPLQTQKMCLSLYAMEYSAGEVQYMSTPTLNEAWTYGSDFSRGIRVAGVNGINLFISGTASVDEEGSTVHENDFVAQAERMILNISTLLQNQRASWADVVSAITYLKNPDDAPSLLKVFKRKGIEGFPNALVQARVCRSNLLCEMEAVAIKNAGHNYGGHCTTGSSIELELAPV
jgi:enamine deaminase RidA (YjgF/YER057c/UK114 family)